MKVDLNSQLTQQIKKLKYDSTISVLSGNYKNARIAHRELAKIGVDNFEMLINTPSPITGTFTLFSREGWNALKFVILNKFYKKTPEEKQLATMFKLYKEGNLKF